MPAKQSYVYIMASGKNGTLYIGVTSDIVKRISQHKEKIYKGFTEQYDVTQLVYYEVYEDIENAIKREKNMKAWKREWKIELIEKTNPQWHDLFTQIAG